jgi:membrane-bound metal-dependent hydrolase YbcI (DUF457 family)
VLHPTHQLIGVAAVAPLAEHAQTLPAGAAIVLAGSVLGSLLPDADHVNARIHRLTRTERRRPILLVATILPRLILRLLTRLPHRGPLTHGLPAMLLVAYLLVAVHATGNPVIVAAARGVAVGYLAHLLVGDGVTVDGLPGWPVCRRIYTAPPFLRIRSGGAGELVYAVLALTAIYLTVRYQIGAPA